MASLRPGQPQDSHFATFSLNLAHNENLLMILHAGSTAQARRRHRRRNTASPDATPSTTHLGNHSPTVSEGYQSSDDSLHLPSSTRQRRARANTHFLPPLPAVAGASVPHDSAAAASRLPRRNSASSVSSALSWQESIFHVRRLSDVLDDRMYAPMARPRVEGRRLVVPPPRHGSRPHPNPLRSNPVFEGRWF